MRPLILIYGGESHYENYCRALDDAGMRCVVSDCVAELSAYHALLLPGGGDFQNNTLPASEREVIAAFIRLGRPIFGICRGMQALNLYFGGTLYDYVPRHQRSGSDILHKTYARGMLAQLLGSTPVVNSNHHQAVARLGRELTVCQWAPDGVVEGVFHRRLPVLGVQWHPERQSFALRRGDAADAAPIWRWFASEAIRCFGEKTV